MFISGRMDYNFGFEFLEDSIHFCSVLNVPYNRENIFSIRSQTIDKVKKIRFIDVNGDEFTGLELENRFCEFRTYGPSGTSD